MLNYFYTNHRNKKDESIRSKMVQLSIIVLTRIYNNFKPCTAHVLNREVCIDGNITNRIVFPLIDVARYAWVSQHAIYRPEFALDVFIDFPSGYEETLCCKCTCTSKQRSHIVFVSKLI